MRKLTLFMLVIGLSILTGYSNEKTEKPHVSEQTKKIQTTDHLLPFHNSRPRKEQVTHIVIHYISDTSSNPKQPYSLEKIRSLYVDYGVSAHYMIGRDGEIYRLVSEHRVAYHAGKGYLHGFPKYKDNLNEYSIGIELMAIGTKEEMEPLLQKGTYSSINPSHIGYTDTQYDSLNQLLNHLYQKYPTIIRNRWHVVGHDQYAPGRKTDPGNLFDWSRIRFD
jgi:N-acetyl-anhydromuramyl-L-alanine amidase AmpD